MTILTNRPL